MMEGTSSSFVLSEADRRKVEALLWGNARRDPQAAAETWATLLGGSLRVPLTTEARRRFDWFFAYNTKFRGNAKRVCRYFGISRKTFYRWKKKFDVLDLHSLEDGSHRPIHGPLPKLKPEQNQLLFELRFGNPHYSKLKIAALCEQRHGMKISSWQVQKVIERYQLYPDKKLARRRAYKRLHGFKKKRITKLIKEPKTGFLVSVDTVILRQNKLHLYMLTALDTHSRWGFARVYKSHSSNAAAEFLRLLQKNMRRRIQNIQTDNGSEFHQHFQRTAQELKLGHYWSRVRTPKDNSQLERFNRTVREEFLVDWPNCVDVNFLNGALVQWLDEYNHERPHAALQYRTPAMAAWGA